MSLDPRRMLEEIQERLRAYKDHKNDPYAYDPREVEAVRALFDNAESDIEFLLTLIKLAEKLDERLAQILDDGC